MVLKSTLRDTISEVLDEHAVEDADLLDNLVDRLQSVVDVMNDDEEEPEEEAVFALGDEEE